MLDALEFAFSDPYHYWGLTFWLFMLLSSVELAARKLSECRPFDNAIHIDQSTDESDHSCVWER